MYKDDGSDVPGNVKGLSAKRRRQWAAVWNSAYKSCGSGSECESKAFQMANGVIKKEVKEAGMRMKAAKAEHLADLKAAAEKLVSGLEDLLDWAEYNDLIDDGTGGNAAGYEIEPEDDDAPEDDMEEVSGPGGMFGAKGGEQIRGKLWRAGSGKFSSGPSPEQLADIGIDQGVSDALLALAEGKPLSPEQLMALKDQGMVTNMGKLNKYGLSMARALKNKDVNTAKGLLALNKPKGKSAKPGKEKPVKKTKEELQAEKEKAIADKLNSMDDFKATEALMKVRRGDQVDEKSARELYDNGLMDEKGILTKDGKAMALAVQRGDIDGARSALDAARKALNAPAPETRTKEQIKMEATSKKLSDNGFDDVESLMSVRNGDTIDNEVATRLTDMGLMLDGRLTKEGKGVALSALRGDVDSALSYIAAAAAKKKVGGAG